MATNLPVHPSRGVALRQIWGGAGFIALSAGMGWVGYIGVATGTASVGIALMGFGVHLLRTGPAVMIVNSALDSIARGNLAQAEERLAAVPAGRRSGSVARAIGQQRAMIALRRGEAKQAVAHATAALEASVSLLSAAHDRMMIEHARAIRALAEASLGDEPKAKADIETVRASSHSAPHALALASLAEAVLLSRADDRDALARLLSRERTLLLEFTSPRERALVRALQRMLRARKTSVYREPAKREEIDPSGEPALASWIAAVAPQAAAFAPQAGPKRTSAKQVGLENEPNPASVARIEKVQAARGRVAYKRKAVMVLLLWLLLIVMFVAIWQFMQPGGPDTPPTWSEEHPGYLLMLPSVLVVLLVALFFGLLLFRIVKTRTLTARGIQAARLLALGDAAAADRAYIALLRAPSLTSAGAHLQLAVAQERRGRFGEALHHCDEGIAKLANLKALASDLLLPELLAERALLLAALDRHDDATTQLAALTTGYPSFAFLSRAQLRVRLMQAARRGDLDKARELARERTPDLPLNVRDEMLADVLVAAVDPVPEGEHERLREELREDGELSAWLDKVAPAALAAWSRVAASREAQA
jgi:hypothetical protein